MEISSTVALFIAIGTQVVTALGLFWAVTSSFHKEIGELRVEQTRQAGEIHRLADKVDYIYKFLPTPKLAIQQPEV